VHSPRADGNSTSNTRNVCEDISQRVANKLRRAVRTRQGATSRPEFPKSSTQNRFETPAPGLAVNALGDACSCRRRSGHRKAHWIEGLSGRPDFAVSIEPSALGDKCGFRRFNCSSRASFYLDSGVRMPASLKHLQLGCVFSQHGFTSDSVAGQWGNDTRASTGRSRPCDTTASRQSTTFYPSGCAMGCCCWLKRLR
jgi:hypothetical protein